MREQANAAQLNSAQLSPWCVSLRVVFVSMLPHMLVSCSAVLLLLLLSSTLAAAAAAAAATPLPHVRPPAAERKFNSTAVNDLIANFTARMIDPDLATLFENCYPNTLDTTVSFYDPGTPTSPPSSFLITGDIDAQWFRDSSNQLLPYVPLAPADPELASLICGLINRHAADVSHDPMANSFNFNASGAGHQSDDRFPPMTPQVFEGKYELDSLAAVLKLASSYYNTTGDKNCFLTSAVWLAAMTTLVDTIATFQSASGSPDDSSYRFQRLTTSATDTLQNGGMGPPSAATGMSRSMFRPSDDATTFPFLIPAEAMAVVELRNLAKMLNQFVSELDVETALQLGEAHFDQMLQLATDAATLAKQIDAGIQNFGIVNDPDIGK
jgi:meiotically up-regulated gene 157 (Mug157) protein